MDLNLFQKLGTKSRVANWQMLCEGGSMILSNLIHRLVHKCMQSRRLLQFFIWSFLIIKLYGDVHYNWKLTLHQEEKTFVNFMSKSKKINRFNWKDWARIKPCTYS